MLILARRNLRTTPNIKSLFIYEFVIILGGPLTAEIEPGRNVIVGVVSFGHASGCTLGLMIFDYKFSTEF